MQVMIPSAELLAQWAAEELWDWRVRLLFATVCAFALIATLAIYIFFGRDRKPSDVGRARRYMGRVSVTMFVATICEASFFKEPVATVLLAVTATAIGAIALSMPRQTDLLSDPIANANEEPGGLV